MINKAFTLVELLVVIVVIGILSSIGVASFTGYGHKAKDARTEIQINQIAKIIRADMALKGSVRYHHEYQSGADGAERIVKQIYESGGSLPDPSQACYLILVLAIYEDQLVSNTKESGIGVVTYKSGIDPRTTVIPVTDRDFDKYMIGSGTANVMDILKNPNSYPPGATNSWANRLRSDMNNYLAVGCKRDPRWTWNGAAIRSAPHYHVFSLIPLDPSLAP